VSFDVEDAYRRRFDGEEGARHLLWKALCEGFFQRYVPEDATVLDVGAGYCEFINNIKAARRIAVDVNPQTARRASDGVKSIQSRSTDLSAVEASSVDVVFASNLFEHLSREDIVKTVEQAHMVLKGGGRLLILQPNIRFSQSDYWMFFDHITPIDDRALCEVLGLHGFQVEEDISRFLPYTTKSRLPKAPALVKAYLRLPPLWRVFGRQSFILARKR